MNKKLVYLMIFACTWSFPFCQPALAQKENTAIQSVKMDIKIINLINSLNLSEEQQRFIHNRAQRAKKIRDKAFLKINDKETQMYNTYVQLKSEFQKGKVKAGQSVTYDFRKDKESLLRIYKEVESQVQEIANEVENHLEEFQIIALKEYKACIIPQVESGRIGQSDSSERLVKMLEKVRTVPEKHYRMRKHEMIDRIMDKVVLRVPPGVEFNAESARANLEEIFTEARQLDDMDYVLAQSRLVSQIKNSVMGKRKTDIERSSVEMIRRFLLHENVIPLLEERMRG